MSFTVRLGRSRIFAADGVSYNSMDNRSMPEITIEDDLRPDYASPMDVPDYGQFLLQELLPHVEQAANVRLTEDPKRRICCGASSGGVVLYGRSHDRA